MLGIYVTVPVVCFRKGLAREYLETEPLPPPATCYGFLLSYVGETDRRSHVGTRIAPVLIGTPPTSGTRKCPSRVDFPRSPLRRNRTFALGLTEPPPSGRSQGPSRVVCGR